MNEMVGLQEAAKMLNITVWSLILELRKPDCFYGCCITVNKKNCYFVSRKALEQWIKDNPEKYHNHPNYISGMRYSLKRFSTDELLEELKARCAI